MGEVTVPSGGSARLSSDGYEFVIEHDTWKLNRDKSVHLSWLKECCALPMAVGIRQLLAYFAEDYSGGYTVAINERLKAMLRWIKERRGEQLIKLTECDVAAYRSTLRDETEVRLGTIVAALKTAVDQGGEWIEKQVWKLLDGYRLKGVTKGLSVSLRCPRTGAITHLEQEALESALVAAFESGETNLETFALGLIFIATGRRPVQIADLKAIDLISAESPEEILQFMLRVPRRKQGGGETWRQEFKDVALTPEIGAVFRALVLESDLRLKKMFPSLAAKARQRLPIFPNWSEVENCHDANAAKELMQGQFWHRPTASFRKQLQELVTRIKVPSERTGTLHIFPYRLRRSVATRAAEEGYGSAVIAEILDHSDDQNARVYTENVPDAVVAINAAVARQLAPLAQAFAGVIVKSERHAIRGEDPTSRIRTQNGVGAGTCGRYGFCGALAPVACYTCKLFQPWVDGPHEEVRDALLADRQRVLEVTGDERIAAINDRTILAVTEVIMACEARRAQEVCA